MEDFGLLLARGSVGVFFAISGYHKLFNADRHAKLVETLTADHVPFVRFNAWFVPTVELIAGAALALGMLSTISALLLGAICLVATCVDGCKRVEEWKPVDFADRVDDYLYLPEVLLGVLLLVTIMCGPGAYSLDAFVQTRGV